MLIPGVTVQIHYQGTEKLLDINRYSPEYVELNKPLFEEVSRHLCSGGPGLHCSHHPEPLSPGWPTCLVSGPRLLGGSLGEVLKAQTLNSQDGIKLSQRLWAALSPV